MINRDGAGIIKGEKISFITQDERGREYRVVVIVEDVSLLDDKSNSNEILQIRIV